MLLRDFLLLYCEFELDRKLHIVDTYDNKTYEYTLKELMTKEFLKAFSIMRTVGAFSIQDNTLQIRVFKNIQ